MLAEEDGEAHAEHQQQGRRSIWEWLYCLLRDTYEDEPMEPATSDRQPLMGMPEVYQHVSTAAGSVWFEYDIYIRHVTRHIIALVYEEHVMLQM